jgi:hypothetical protein
MWSVYLGLAVLSPIAVIALRRFLTDESPKTREGAAA